MAAASPAFGSPARRSGGGLLDGPRCRAFCTARACCQLLQLLLCLLLLACGAVSAGDPGGYTGLLSLGGAHYYAYGGAYSGFSGPDGETAQRLDAQFRRLKLPPAQLALAVGGGLAALPALQLGARMLGLPGLERGWLVVVSAGLEAAAGAGLVVATWFFYRLLGDVYTSPLCAKRERFYADKGYHGFGCQLHGAEVAAGAFAAGATLAFLVGAGLALRGLCGGKTARQSPSSLATRAPEGSSCCGSLRTAQGEERLKPVAPSIQAPSGRGRETARRPAPWRGYGPSQLDRQPGILGGEVQNVWRATVV